LFSSCSLPHAYPPLLPRPPKSIIIILKLRSSTKEIQCELGGVKNPGRRLGDGQDYELLETGQIEGGVCWSVSVARSFEYEGPGFVCLCACVHFARFVCFCVFALVFPSSVFACLFFFSLSLSFFCWVFLGSFFLPDLKIKCRPPPITIFPVAWSFAKDLAFVWNHPFLVTCVLVLIVFFLFFLGVWVTFSLRFL